MISGKQKANTFAFESFAILHNGDTSAVTLTGKISNAKVPVFCLSKNT